VQPQVSYTRTTVTFTWAAGAGRHYRIQFKNTLSEPVWQTLGPDITATTTTASASDPSYGRVPQRFYRIAVVH
jgi:hypothetical protein